MHTMHDIAKDVQYLIRINQDKDNSKIDCPANVQSTKSFETFEDLRQFDTELEDTAAFTKTVCLYNII